jgi:cell division protein FtsL
MNNVTQVVQRVYQAPWRIQRQWIGLFLLGLVSIAMMAGIYLNITARTALAGREIQELDNEIIDNQRTNADLETKLASQTSTSTMTQRALALDFQPVRSEEVTYVTVPGYVPEAPLDMSSGKTQPADTLILPEYSQSLFDWFIETFAASSPTAGVYP